MKVAVTGGIGSGKSRVAAILAGLLQAELFSADRVCHQLLEPGASGWRGIVAAWGERYLAADRTLNRPALRTDVFRDAALRRQLEAILHPLIRNTLKNSMAAVDINGGTCIVEVPLLFEVGWQDDFDAVVAVYAPAPVCIARIVDRDGIAPEEAGRILGAQMSPEEKAGLAGHVIDNSGLWSLTYLQAARLARLIGGKTARDEKPPILQDKA